MESCAPGILAAKNLALVSMGTTVSTEPATIWVGIAIFVRDSGENAGPIAGAMTKMARMRGSRWDLELSTRADWIAGSDLAKSVALTRRPGYSSVSWHMPSALEDLQKSWKRESSAMPPAISITVRPPREKPAAPMRLGSMCGPKVESASI